MSDSLDALAAPHIARQYHLKCVECVLPGISLVCYAVGSVNCLHYRGVYGGYFWRGYLCGVFVVCCVCLGLDIVGVMANAMAAPPPTSGRASIVDQRR